MDINGRNPYAPPQANVERAAAPPSEAPPLWNPNAAAAWSLLFTPIFGALLHMKNWQALGQPRKAAESRAWALGCLILFIVLTITPLIWDKSQFLASMNKSWGLLILFSWYYSSGKPQRNYVLERFGKNYPRRGWAKPLLLALAAVVALSVILMGIDFVIASLRQ